jgi:hypothetical protein
MKHYYGGEQMRRITALASAILLVGVAAFATTEDTSWGKIKEQVKEDAQPAAKKSVDSQGVATANECAQPATITASSYFWWGSDPSNGPAANAIDCDASTNWNAGGAGPASVTVIFDSPRTLSGLYVTSHASALGDQNYTVTATRPDNTTDVVSAPFAIQPWWLTYPEYPSPTLTSMAFDLGQGFVEYTSVQIDITNTTPWTWKAINEIELIVPVNPESQGDCKNGGWEQFGFKNQGQCVRFIETGKDSR